LRLRPMTLSHDDYQKLKSLLTSRLTCALSDPIMLRSLNQELQRAKLVPPGELNDVIVGMNATITLRDLQSDGVETYTLVYPAHADIANRRLSVLSPVGVEVLGCRCGDNIGWLTHSGWRMMTIEKVVSSSHLRPGGCENADSPEREQDVHSSHPEEDDELVKQVIEASGTRRPEPHKAGVRPGTVFRGKEP
jgi:regulator of nucleoside diphosphate kinase